MSEDVFLISPVVMPLLRIEEYKPGPLLNRRGNETFSIYEACGYAASARTLGPSKVVGVIKKKKKATKNQKKSCRKKRRLKGGPCLVKCLSVLYSLVFFLLIILVTCSLLGVRQTLASIPVRREPGDETG